MISVIIPTYNDEGLIKSTIAHLQENAYKRLLKEVIVVDAGSTDNTVREATEAGAMIIRSIRRERGLQLNLGAQAATGKILYFVSPGTFPPNHYTNEIVRATMKGFSFGCFSLTADHRHWMLKVLNRFTKSKIDYTRLENHSLFVLKELFDKSGRFREDMMILEDREMIARLKRYGTFTILNDKLVPSSVKNPVSTAARAEFSFMIAWIMYDMGYSQQKLVKVYRALLGRHASAYGRTDTLSASLTS
ncbi:MAG TPA: glycosyltransferase [Chryseosolibacter sp.]|nr:glycosyltransferase [Chryseosolibacter sp.]